MAKLDERRLVATGKGERCEVMAVGDTCVGQGEGSTIRKKARGRSGCGLADGAAGRSAWYRADDKTQMTRLLDWLEKASGGVELPNAVKGLEEFLCFELCAGDETATLRFELSLCFDAERLRRPEVHEALLVRMLGDSLRGGERLQARLLADFAQLKEENAAVVSKGRKRQKNECFAQVVAGEMADDLLSLHHERLCQASACFELEEPDAALACLRDYACFLDCAVLPHARLMAELSFNDAWAVLSEKVRPLKDACWEARNR